MSLPQYKISSKSTSRFYRTEQHEVKVIFNVIISIQNVIQIHQSVHKLHHLRSLNVRHFGAIDVTFSVITSIQNVIQIHQSVQTLSGVLFTHLKSLDVRQLEWLKLRDLKNVTSR
jgi:hypothetical protein